LPFCIFEIQDFNRINMAIKHHHAKFRVDGLNHCGEWRCCHFLEFTRWRSFRMWRFSETVPDSMGVEGAGLVLWVGGPPDASF